MTIAFMLLGLPRSGTTWAANWLTTDRSMCWHDPVGRALPREIDLWDSGSRICGISCTGSWLWVDWINSHPARKIILERAPEEVNASLQRLGLPTFTREIIAKFRAIRAHRVPWTDLWEKPRNIWSALLPEIPFDVERHYELSQMSVTPLDAPLSNARMEHLASALKELRRN